MNKVIHSYVSRYVVPFYFDCEKNGYERTCKNFKNTAGDNQVIRLPKDGKWIEAGFWENYRSINYGTDENLQAEMDLYSYLPSIYAEPDDKTKTDIKNLGKSFVYKTNGILFDLEYKYGEKSIPLVCKDLGVIVYRSGIGFLWYEIKFRNEISTEEYVAFQHDFKELARTHDDKFVKKEFNQEKKEILYEQFVLGEWLSNLISSESTGIRFWAERISKNEDIMLHIPDKALLFQYIFIEEATDQEAKNLLFHVTNGYNEKYNPPANMEGNTYSPFGNTSFYVTKAGMGCVVINEKSNERFFDGQFRGKYIRDYFFIYILLLYQSFSCTHCSKLLTNLPADENKMAKYLSKLEILSEQINLFLVKSLFESVSNVHHQNGLYRYGKTELCIKDDIQSLTIGVDALKNIEREKSERKISFALTVFGFIVVVSAWIDGLNLVDWFNNNGSIISLWHIVISMSIVLSAVYLIYVLWKEIKNTVIRS